jgi:hypothetical protein
MIWTDLQWDAFRGILEEAWPGEFTEDTEQVWRVLLDPVDPADATAALKRLLYRGERFRPSASELLAEIRADHSKPTFEEAYELIFGRRGALKADAPGVFPSTQAMHKARVEAIMARAGEMHPLIGSFIERQGATRLLNLPVHHEEWGEQRRRELREAWDRHTEAFDGREVAALASGRPEGLRELDPLAVLDIPAPQPALTTGQETG